MTAESKSELNEALEVDDEVTIWLGDRLGDRLEDDARTLLAFAYVLAPQKTSSTGLVSTSTVFLAAIEWGMAENPSTEPPLPLRNLATFVRNHAADAYSETMATFFRDGVEFPDATLLARTDFNTIATASNNLDMLVGLIGLDGRSADAAQVVLELLNFVQVRDYQGDSFHNLLRQLGGLQPVHYAAALLRRGGVDHALSNDNSELSIALTDRPLWLCQYRRTDSTQLEGRMSPGSVESWDIKPKSSSELQSAMRPGDVVAIWRTVDNKEYSGKPSSRGGVVGWAQIEALPTSESDQISLRLRDSFPNSPISRDNVLRFVENTGKNWPGQISLRELEQGEVEIFRHLFSVAEDPGASGDRPTEVTLSSDRAETTRDLLDRGPLAFSLASLINAVQDDQLAAGDSGKVPSEAAFVLHIDSPWGGGKTTFANYITRMLNPSQYGIDLQQLGKNTGDNVSVFAAVAEKIASRWPQRWRERKWISVPFNAWQHQHVSPPWWDFYQTIRKGYLETLPWPKRVVNHLSEGWWRLRMPGVWMPFVGLLIFAALLFVVAILTNAFSGQEAADQNWFSSLFKKPESSSIGFWPLFLTLVGGGSGLALINSLRNGLQNVIVTAGSAVDSENLGDSDPLDRLRRRFASQAAKLSRHAQRPLVVVIDDLDRCEPEYVVELMRGLLTVFRSPYVVYLLLGDKHWIEASFAQVHDNMRDAHRSEDISFGARFAEKVIQLSFLLPEADESVRDAYFGYLLTGERKGPQQSDPARDEQLNAFVTEARQQLANRRSAKEIDAEAEKLIQQAGNQFGGDAETLRSLTRAINTEAVVNTAYSDDVRQDVAHRLMDFRRCLPENPRRIKRIINMVAIYQGSARVLQAITPGTDKWRQLVLWIILMSEHPGLWQVLARDPRIADLLLAARKADLDEDALDKETIDLLSAHLQNDAAMRILSGGSTEEIPQLDSAAVSWLVKLTPV